MTDNLSNPLRAIYFEDDNQQFATFAPHLQRILSYKSARAEVIRASTRDDLQALMKSRPHVVFCDNDHKDLGPQEGVYQISRLKPHHPDTVFCLVTREAFHTRSLASYTPNPDVLVYKAQLGTTAYDHYLGRIFRRQIRRSPMPPVMSQLDFKKDGPSHRERHILQPEELHSILEQVVDAEGVPVLAFEFKSAELEVIKGGFSGSGVYSLNVTREDGRSNIPAILKISERERATHEFENFLKFVKWRLPYIWRVDVLGTAYTGNFGAICYSPAMGGFAQPSAVNTYIRNGHFDVIEKVLGSVLHSRNQTWYGEQRSSGVDIRDYFSRTNFYRTSARREVLEDEFYAYIEKSLNEAGQDFHQTQAYLQVFDTRYAKIDALIFSNEWGKVSECVCHGDMNGNNLLYAGEGSPVVFIDFQDTGFSHVFRDFVTFESSIRLECPDDRLDNEDDLAMFKRYLAVERALAAAQWSKIDREHGYVSYASDIRAAANSNFGAEPLALYLVANVVHTLWLFEKSRKWAVHKRLRLAATILESALALYKLRSEAGKH
jgi:hypothetical protein